jgi:hypothetical protein
MNSVIVFLGKGVLRASWGVEASDYTHDLLMGGRRREGRFRVLR